MLKIGNMEIPTSATVTKNGTDVTIVKVENAIVWEKAQKKQISSWLIIEDNTLYINKEVVSYQGTAEVAGVITCNDGIFTGVSVVHFTYDGFNTFFALSSNGTNKITAFYGSTANGSSISSSLTFNNTTKKFTGTLTLTLKWDGLFGDGETEVYKITAQSDGGIKAYMSWSDGGSHNNVLEGNTIYLI